MVGIKKTKGKKAFSERKKKQIIFYTSIVLLPIIQALICYVYVNLNSFILAFQKYSYKEDALGINVAFAGFSNFVEAWGIIQERAFMLGNSLQLAFWTVAMELFLALLFSFYIYKKYPFSEVFRVVLFIPKITSAVVFVIIYKYLANEVFLEIANNILHVEPQLELGFLDNPATERAAIIFFCCWVGFGVNVLMFTGAMSGIDESIVESAHLDGTNLLQEFFFITVPMIWGTFVSFFVVAITGIFTNQMHLHTFYGTTYTGKLSTFGFYLYSNAAQSEVITTGIVPNFSVLSAIGLILTMIMLPITLIVRKLLNKYGPSTD